MTVERLKQCFGVISLVNVADGIIRNLKLIAMNALVLLIRDGLWTGLAEKE